MPKLKLKKIEVHEPTKGMIEESPMMWTPSFSISDKQMSEVKDCDVGKKYRFVIEVEMKSKREVEKGIEAGFDIVAYKIIKEKAPEDMTDEEFGEYQGEKLSERL